MLFHNFGQSFLNAYSQTQNNIKYSLEFLDLIFYIIKNDISTFDDNQLDKLKDKIIFNGPIALKFMQWYLSRKNIENEENNDGQFDRILNKFDDIFDNCPHHSLEETLEIFNDNFGLDMSQVIDIKSLKVIGSGSIGQVYEGYLLDGRKIALKVKHPNISKITGGQLYIINSLIYLQKIQFFKNRMNLHIDIEDFMYNLLLQLDFTNEVFNTLRFSKMFQDNPLIIIPDVYYYSKDIIISKYESGGDYDDLPIYQKNKVGMNFYCFLLTMNIIEDYTHGDLHKKNWQVRKDEDNKDYKIIVYDFGIVFFSNQVEKNKLLWHSFETNNVDGVLECLPYMLVNQNKELPTLSENVKEGLKNIFSGRYGCGIIISNLLNILGKEKLYVNRIFLNILISMTLIEKIFLELDFVNRNSYNNQDMRLRNIASRYGDIYAYCKQYPFYKQVEEYVGGHYNSYQIENLFVNHNNTLKLDDPLELDLELDNPLDLDNNDLD